MKYLKRFSLRSVSDFLSEQEMKSVTGGYDPDPGGGYGGFGKCWSFICSGEPCGKLFLDPCPGDFEGTCSGSSEECFDAIDEMDCPGGFIMWPC